MCPGDAERAIAFVVSSRCEQNFPGGHYSVPYLQISLAPSKLKFTRRSHSIIPRDPRAMEDRSAER
jgi:hypothetical protein